MSRELACRIITTAIQDAERLSGNRYLPGAKKEIHKSHGWRRRQRQELIKFALSEEPKGLDYWCQFTNQSTESIRHRIFSLLGSREAFGGRGKETQ